VRTDRRGSIQGHGRALFLVALLFASTLTGLALYSAFAPPSQPPPAQTPVPVTPSQISLNAGTGSTSIDAKVCDNTVSVAANSVLMIGGTHYEDNEMTFAVHGQTPTTIVDSAVSSTYPNTVIAGVLEPSAATVTYYVNYSTAGYWTCFGADFQLTTANATFYQTSAAMTNANTTAITACGNHIVTTVAGEMIFAVWGDKTTHAYGVTYTLGSGQTKISTETTTTDIVYGEDAYLLTTSAGHYGMNATATQALDSSGACVAILPTAVPRAATSLTVGAVTTTTIPYTWTNPPGPSSVYTNDTLYSFTSATCASGVTGYNLGGVVTSYTVTGLSSATEYGAAVAVWNSTGQGTHTACVDGTTLPTAPTSPSASPASTTSITVTWTNPSGTLTNDYVFYEAGTSCSAATQDTVGSVTTTYTVTGLTTNQKYCFYVEAVSAGGPSAASSTVTAITESVPAAPTSLTVASVTLTTASLTWSNPTTGGLLNSTVYYYAGTACSGAHTGISVGSVVTSYTITGLTTNTQYAIQVTVWNATGQSPDSSCVVALTASVPAAPSSLMVTAESLTTISISWSNPSTGGLVNSTVYYWSGGSCTGAHTGISMSGVVTSYTVTGLTSNDRYSLEVTVWNATGQSLDSSCVAATTASVPAAPTALMVSSVALTSVSLSWSNPSTGGLVNSTLYNYTGTACSGAVTGTSIGSAVTSYTLTGLVTNTHYSFQVTVWNGTGQSPDSSCVTALTASVPGAPTSVTVGTVTITTISVSWTNPTTGGLVNDTGYITTTASCAGTLTPMGTSGAATSVEFTGLSSGTEYYIEITAWNATGQSAKSLCVSATTLNAIPAAPTGLSALGETETTITVSWSNPGSPPLVNVTVYYIAAATCTGGATGISAGVVTSQLITGLTASTEYSIDVTAWSNGGQSPDSNCVTVSTTSGGQVPQAPEGMSLISETTSTLTLQWQNPPGTLTNVTLYYARGSCTDPGAYTAVSLTVVDTTTITGLPAGTTFDAYVTAWNSTGQSAPSDCLTVTTDPSPGGGGGGGGGAPPTPPPIIVPTVPSSVGPEWPIWVGVAVMVAGVVLVAIRQTLFGAALLGIGAVVMVLGFFLLGIL
jgi:hypothetical protein